MIITLLGVISAIWL